MGTFISIYLPRTTPISRWGEKRSTMLNSGLDYLKKTFTEMRLPVEC